MDGWRKVFRLDPVSLAFYQSELNRIYQFPHISRPYMGLQYRKSCRGKGDLLSPGFFKELVKKVLDQMRNILSSIPEGGGQ